MEYIDEGMFPGISGAFPMTRKGIEKSTIIEMMNRNSTDINLTRIKDTFEKILGVNINECSVEIKNAVKDDKNSLKGVLSDYQKALKVCKKMTTKEFFDAKLRAQRSGIVSSIASLESILRYSMSPEQKDRYQTQLDYYKKDLQLWDSLGPDEQFYFLVKSMADFEMKNSVYYGLDAEREEPKFSPIAEELEMAM